MCTISLSEGNSYLPCFEEEERREGDENRYLRVMRSNHFITQCLSYMIVRVVFGVGAEPVVEVAEDLLGQEGVLRLEGVGRRVEVDLHEVGLDHSAPEI